MNNDFRPDEWENEWGNEWDDEDWDDCDCYERKHSSRKIRYVFAGLLLFFMWLVRRDAKKVDVDAEDEE